jgi:predicted ATP-grasp superfamily ATP-dependent carboligase
MFVVQGSGEVDVLVEHARRSLRPEDRLLFGESLLGRDLVRYSVAFCRARRQFHAFEATKERPAAVTGGVGTFVRLTEAPAAREMARRVAEALDYYGMGEMEVFHDRRHGRHYAIEINARPWMQLGMERLAGRDFVGFLAGFSDGSRGVPRPGAAWADVLGDLYGRYSRTGRATAAGEPGYLRSFASVRSFKYFAVRDPGPAIVEMGRWIDAAIRRRLTGRGT